MVSPVRRREAVEMIEDRLKVSQRRVCSTLGQHRCTQRYRPVAVSRTPRSWRPFVAGLAPSRTGATAWWPASCDKKKLGGEL
jgi:hypothetical protein